MDQKQFDKLVSSHEETAKNHPRYYKLRVLLIALGGYAYIALVMLALIGLFLGLGKAYYSTNGNIIVGGLAFSTVWLMLIVFASLWTSTDVPKGIRLNKKKHPALFHLISEVRQKIRAPKIHQVLLDPDLNASITQRNRLGVFGWNTNYLVVGLPALIALSPDQFKALLAHEYGHLAGDHGKFGNWVYRKRKFWNQLFDKLRKNDHGGDFIFSGFYSWYAPFFEAYTFVLARANEYEADQCAVAVVGKETAADTLATIETKFMYVNDVVWPAIYAQVDEQSAPESGIYHRMRDMLGSDFAPASKELLERALKNKTNNLDTHPSLSDRLAAIGVAPQAPSTGQLDAASVLLGNEFEKISQTLEAEWRESISPEWSQVHETARDKKDSLQQYDTLVNERKLTADEYWQYAILKEELQGADSAKQLYRDLISHYPGHAYGRFAVGEDFIKENNKEGLVHIKRAMEIDESLTLPGLTAVYHFLSKNGPESEAEEVGQQLEARQHVEALASQERRSLSIFDILTPHSLPEERLETLRDKLREHWQIEDAYLVEKDVENFPERIALFLVITRQPGESSLSNDEFMQEMNQVLQLPREIILLLLTPEDRKLVKFIQKIKGSHFYNRRKHQRNK